MKRDLFLTTRLPQLLSGSSAYVAASRFSEAQTCKQVVGLGFRTYCHRRASRVSELVFFTGKHPEGPLSRGVLFSDLPAQVGRLDISVLNRTLEQCCVIKQGEPLTCLLYWDSSPHQCKCSNCSCCSFKLLTFPLPSLLIPK